MRVLIISQEPHLALALQIVLSERGYLVRCEKDSFQAIGTIKEFSPDVLLTASAAAVFVSRRHSPDIADLPRPVDTDELLRLLESDLVGAAG